jgi:hypothetical protein
MVAAAGTPGRWCRIAGHRRRGDLVQGLGWKEEWVSWRIWGRTALGCRRAVDAAQDCPSVGTAAPPPQRPALAATVAARRAAPRTTAHHRASRRCLPPAPPPREILRERRRHHGLRALLPPCLALSLGLGFGGTGVGRWGWSGGAGVGEGRGDVRTGGGRCAPQRQA